LKDTSKPPSVSLSNVRFGQFDERGKLSINQQEAQKIFLKFKALYINRVHFLGTQKREIEVDVDCTFKPQVSKTSRHLAEAHRQKIFEMHPENHTQDAAIVEILLNPN
jgi:hypothetical protein